MNNELFEAKKTLAQATWRWTDRYDSVAVRDALAVLIEAMGGKGWVASHPRYRNAIPPVLHAAGMREDEMIDSLPATLAVHDTELHFSRSDVRFLLSMQT